MRSNTRRWGLLALAVCVPLLQAAVAPAAWGAQRIAPQPGAREASRGVPPRDGEALRAIWTLGRAVKAGEDLTPGDLVPVQLPAREVPAGAVLDPAEVVGTKAVRSLQGGTVVLRDHFKEIPLVRKGQSVHIVLESPALRLVAAGECLQEGGAGDRVRVINLSSRQVITARVQDAHTVRVDFGYGGMDLTAPSGGRTAGMP
jgi:flagella basal body P-ring formation protein FlgA